MKKISIIIPAWNEEKIIYDNLKKIEEVFDRSLGKLQVGYELIVVDDGSTDNSYVEAKKASKENKKIKVVRYKNNGGKGSALTYGFRFCSGGFVAFLDADLDLHPEHVTQFIKHMEKHGADIVIGSKRHPSSKINYPISRKILSQAYNVLIRLLFHLNLTDTQTGLKLFKYEVLEKVLPIILCKQYAFDLELLVNINSRGYKIAEAPIELRWQRSKNRLTLGDIWKIALDTAAIFYRMKILRYYDKRYRERDVVENT
jgi:glycosyltransferase involved in cell wall biosynthesis